MNSPSECPQKGKKRERVTQGEKRILDEPPNLHQDIKKLHSVSTWESQHEQGLMLENELNPSQIPHAPTCSYLLQEDVHHPSPQITFSNKFSNTTSGIYLKNSPAHYIKENQKKQQKETHRIPFIIYFNITMLSILKGIQEKNKNFGRGGKTTKRKLWI